MDEARNDSVITVSLEEWNELVAMREQVKIFKRVFDQEATSRYRSSTIENAAIIFGFCLPKEKTDDD